MARMLYNTNPGFRRRCRKWRCGCTCYYYVYSAKADKLRRRAARKTEKAQVMRELRRDEG